MEYCQLSQGERYVMANMLRQGFKQADIARALERSKSTISRERKRNATRYDGHYRAQRAQEYAMARRWRTRKGSQYSQQEWKAVSRQLQSKWSPQQISGRRKLLRQRSISKETIYRFVRRDRQQGGQLWRELRIISKYGRKHRNSPATRGRLVGKRHISERPKVVERRIQQGHCEGDTVIGADLHHCVLTMVERVSGFLTVQKMSARTKEQASAALCRTILRHHGRIKTITLDNGTEFHDYKQVEEQLKVKFYFATPYHSWERGTNENTNGLLRQYLPKGMCLKNLTQAECDKIADEINDRPRLRLGYRTPREVYSRS